MVAVGEQDPLAEQGVFQLLPGAGVGAEREPRLGRGVPGQGGREDLTSLAADLTAETEQLFSDDASGSAQVTAYLSKPRAALDGCRLGRLAFDPEIVTDAQLRAPISAFFDRLRALLGDALGRAGDDGELVDGIDRDAVVETICAVVQGGYVIARLSDDPDALGRACSGLVNLLTP